MMVIEIHDKEYIVPTNTSRVTFKSEFEERPISYMYDDEEIVFCGDDPNDGYVGWTPRELADLKGYKIDTIKIERLVPVFQNDLGKEMK